MSYWVYKDLYPFDYRTPHLAMIGEDTALYLAGEQPSSIVFEAELCVD